MTEAVQKFSVLFTNRDGEEQEGPLAVLWRLIESYEVDIFEVSLSRITEDFLNFMKSADVPISEESEFVVMAARLIYYKSKLLLPNPGFEEEYEEDTLPLELVDQLLEYKRFQQAAETLREYEEKNQMSFTREASWGDYSEDIDFLRVDLVSFLKAFQDFMIKEEAARPIQIEEEPVSVEDVMQTITEQVTEKGTMSFFDFIRGAGISMAVAAFLAVLELARLRLITVVQLQYLGDISLHDVEQTEESVQAGEE